ncbi:MAG: hypothetical protein EON93_24015 [Burkholderiales bacterium]|nr:MAG: hypothetical protein EON93_24015 [Burkholderiales bacterium]
MLLAGGAELQRALYSLACRVLLSDDPQRASRLIYLRSPIKSFPLKDQDHVIERLAAWVALAKTRLEEGVVYPGVKPYRDDPRFGRLAMPASSFYLERKEPTIRKAAGTDLARYWREP